MLTRWKIVGYTCFGHFYFQDNRKDPAEWTMEWDSTSETMAKSCLCLDGGPTFLLRFHSIATTIKHTSYSRGFQWIFQLDLCVLSDFDNSFAKFPRENRSCPHWDEFNDEFNICKNWWKNFLLFFPEIVSPWARMLIKRILILGLAILISERFNFNPIFFQPVAKHIEVDIKEITRI